MDTCATLPLFCWYCCSSPSPTLLFPPCFPLRLGFQIRVVWSSTCFYDREVFWWCFAERLIQGVYLWCGFPAACGIDRQRRSACGRSSRLHTRSSKGRVFGGTSCFAVCWKRSIRPFSRREAHGCTWRWEGEPCILWSGIKGYWESWYCINIVAERVSRILPRFI